GLASSLAAPGRLVNTGTRALVPEAVNRERAMPATSVGSGAGPAASGDTVTAALAAVLVSTSSVALTAHTSCWPASSMGGTYVAPVAPSSTAPFTTLHWSAKEIGP